MHNSDEEFWSQTDMTLISLITTWRKILKLSKLEFPLENGINKKKIPTS